MFDIPNTLFIGGYRKIPQIKSNARWQSDYALAIPHVTSLVTPPQKVCLLCPPHLMK